MPDYDLNNIIEDSLTDSALPADPITEPVEAEPTPAEESAPEGIVEAQEAVLEAATEATPTEEESKAKKNQWEDFDKKFGLEPTYPNSGRENRIPYSRVKKIAQKAVRDARKDWEAETSPKSQEAQTKLTSYEQELTTYRNFEKTMVQEPEKFLRMLSSVPAYKQFFTAVEQAFEAMEKGNAQPTPAQQELGDDMPQPDVRLPDGSLVYSEKGLRDLQSWNRDQARKETLAEVDKRYGPIEKEWQAYQRVESLRPKVNAQITEARTWDKFTENEAEIVDVLKNNPQISLEGAYRQVVLPKLKAAWESEKQRLVPDRNKIREELMQELKSAPRATSVPSTSSRSSVEQGPRSLEQIIADQIKTIK